MTSTKSSKKNSLLSPVIIAVVALAFFIMTGDSEDREPAPETESASETKATTEARQAPAETKPKSTVLNVPLPPMGTIPTNKSGDTPTPPRGPIIDEDYPADPPPELPADLAAQLNSPPPELPPDLQAQVDGPPPELPEDIKRALETPPRVVSIEEVNNPDFAIEFEDER